MSKDLSMLLLELFYSFAKQFVSWYDINVKGLKNNKK